MQKTKMHLRAVSLNSIGPQLNKCNEHLYHYTIDALKICGRPETIHHLLLSYRSWLLQ